MRASDLVGCRFRQRQRRAHPDVPELPEALLRQPQIDAARAAGYTRFVAVLTRPRDYVKGPQKRERAVRRILRNTPKVADAMVARPGIYNAAKQSLLREADAHNAYIFFPDAMGVESTELDADKLRANYRAGAEQVERDWPAMKEFLTAQR